MLQQVFRHCCFGVQLTKSTLENYSGYWQAHTLCVPDPGALSGESIKNLALLSCYIKHHKNELKLEKWCNG